MTRDIADRTSAPRGSAVQSLDRALDILELLGRSEIELGVTEIGARVGLASGTAYRLLATLSARGYARQIPDTRKYTLGPKALILASAARERQGPLARPFLKELMEVSQESSNLAMLDRNSVVYLEQVAASRTVRMSIEPGSRAYPHATGTGKVLLAYEPEEVVDSIVRQNGLPRVTPYTITDVRRFKRELERVRKQGYATDSEEREEGVRCLAAPIFGPEGQVVAAMSISGPASRLAKARLEELIPLIKRIATTFSESLGGHA